jgi:hypothetical protein
VYFFPTPIQSAGMNTLFWDMACSMDGCFAKEYEIAAFVGLT